MDSKNFFIGVRLTKEERLRLEALARHSGKSKSEVIRELIVGGWVKERINREHIALLRELTGMATNLNQIARKANTFGYPAAAEQNVEAAADIKTIIKRIRYDGENR